MVAAMGSMEVAAIRALSPRTSCRYCIITKMNPKNTKNWSMIDREPAAKCRLRNSRGSRSGFSRRSSKRTNAVSTARPSPIPRA